jgi:HK97 gp10 family phage protein
MLEFDVHALWGDKEARAIIDRLKENVNESMAKAIGMGSLYVVNTMKELAPVNTGALWKSIDAEIVENKDGQVVAKVGPTKDIEYAKYLEYGTGLYAENGQGRQTRWVYFNKYLQKFFSTIGMKPRKFIYPALQRNAKKLQNLVTLSLVEGFGKITK